jgi:putative transposase
VTRHRRITWLNYPHLIIAQANGGAELFRSDEDYLFYLDQLRQMSRERLLRVYAFCLMETELRLVIVPNRLSLSRILQRLHGRHTAYMNQRLNRCGHLFRGRFRSVVFDMADIANVVRAVHLWPVRLGLFRRAEHYAYSSQQAYLGHNTPFDDFLAVKDLLQIYPGEMDAKRRAFGRFVETAALEADDLGIEESTPGIGGDATTSAELLKKAHLPTKGLRKSSLKSLAERTTLLLNITADQLKSSCRRQDLVMARRLLASAAVLGANRSVTEVAEFLEKDKAQISRLVAQGMDLLNSHEAFAVMFDSIKAKGSQDEEPPVTTAN